MRPIIVSLLDKAISIAGTILARRRGRADSVAQSLKTKRGEDRDGGDYCI